MTNSGRARRNCCRRRFRPRCDRDGAFALTANERHQLGFRLAAMAGHERIYGIDWHDFERAIGWDQAITYAQEHNQIDAISFWTATAETSGEEQAAERERIARTTVREQLRGSNDPAAMQADHQIYMDLARVGDGSSYIGADVVLRWYERNLKMFINLSRIVTDPADRLLVIVGAGHLSLLSHFVQGSGRFHLRSALDFL